MIRLSLINKAYENGYIDLKHISTTHIPSDMLSKMVPAPTDQYMRKFVNGQTPVVTDSTISLPNETNESYYSPPVTSFREYVEDIVL